MRRIVVGFLVLFCIALSGIFLVERGLHSAAADSVEPGSLRVKLRIGGEPSPRGDGLSDHSGAGVSLVDAPREAPAWQPPEPRLRHTIVSGDNLSKIATAYLGSGTKEAIERIQKANKLKSPRDLKVGTTLEIPVERFERFIADGHTTVAAVAERFYGKAERTTPLHHANPNLPKEKDTKIPSGFTVFIPR